MYLDQAHLSDACWPRIDELRGRDPQPAQANFALWLESLASGVNLCISLVHVLELARWPGTEHDSGIVAAEWLESLPYTWVGSPVEIGAAEAAAVLAARLDVAFEPRPVFVDNVFRTSDRWGPGLIGDVRSTLPLPEVVRQARRGTAIEREGFVARESHRRLIIDRARADADNLSLDDRDARRRGRMGLVAAARLGAGCELLFRGGALTPGGEKRLGRVLESVLEDFRSDPGVLPSTYVHATMLVGRARRLDRKAGTSPTKLARQEMSANRDHFHAEVAAAYCDIFTCDGDAATSLGDARAALGLSPPICKVKGTPISESVDTQMACLRGLGPLPTWTRRR